MIDYIMILLKEALFFLILINPMSKIAAISSLSTQIKKKELERLLLKSSLVAFIILIIFTFAGKIILRDIFRIDINALAIAGGIVLSFVGFRALEKGVFFHSEISQSLMDMAIVPLASPLIAGPATITATILRASTVSHLFVIYALAIAIAFHFVIVFYSLKITDVLDKFNLTGAVIRITGLLIMAMGVQMIISGVNPYLF